MQIKLIKTANQEVQHLYEQCFPENERIPYAALFTGVYQNYQLYAFYQKSKLVGLAHFITKKEFVHLNYLAVNPTSRGQGIGSQILTWLKQKFPNQVIIADIEITDQYADNNDLRIKRRKFYQRNGFQSNHLQFDWANETFTPVSFGPLPAQQFIAHLKQIAPNAQNFRACD